MSRTTNRFFLMLAVFFVAILVSTVSAEAKTCKTHTEAQKYIYTQWINRAKTCEYSTTYSATEKGVFYDAGKAFDQVAEKPQYVGNNAYSFRYWKHYVKITFTQSYKNKTQANKYISSTNKAVQKAYNSLSLKNKNVIGKVYTISDYLSKRCVPKDTDVMCSTPYSLFYRKKGNCTAYAASFCMLAQKAGLKVKYVRGTRTIKNKKYGHVWTIVKVGNLWYQTDPSTADIIGGHGSLLRGEEKFSKNGYTLNSTYRSKEFRKKYPMSKKDCKGIILK